MMDAIDRHALGNALLAARANLELLEPDVAARSLAYLGRAMAALDRAAALLSAGPEQGGAMREDRDPASRSRTGLRGRTILVGEDDPAVRDLLVDLLRSAGASVRPAGTTDEVASALVDETFDLVVLDRWLEGSDGLVVAAPWFGRTRFLIVTGERNAQARPTSAVSSAPTAALPTLMKPFRIDAFQNAVVRALDNGYG